PTLLTGRCREDGWAPSTWRWLCTMRSSAPGSGSIHPDGSTNQLEPHDATVLVSPGADFNICGNRSSCVRLRCETQAWHRRVDDDYSVATIRASDQYIQRSLARLSNNFREI